MPRLSRTPKASAACKARIFVVGPRRLQNELMACVLNRKRGIRCDTVSNVSDISLLCRWRENGANILLLDCAGKPAQPLVEGVRSESPESVLCLFNAEDDGTLGHLIGKVKGFFFENSSMDQLVKGIGAVLAGRLWLPREVIDRYVLNPEGVSYGRRAVSPLSRKETEILEMVAGGVPNRLIASKLGLSNHTIKTHLYKLYKKLKVSNRVQATKWAAENLGVS